LELYAIIGGEQSGMSGPLESVFYDVDLCKLYHIWNFFLSFFLALLQDCLVLQEILFNLDLYILEFLELLLPSDELELDPVVNFVAYLGCKVPRLTSH
jgi:hypothetical protein